jgi:hypothetical protein
MSTTNRCRVCGMAAMAVALGLGYASLAGAHPAHDPPAPAADVGASTTPGRATLGRGHRQHKMSVGPVAPVEQASKPQPAVVEVKSLAQKRARLDKEEAK